MEIQQEFLKDLQANTEKALETVDFMAIGQQTGFANPYLLFDSYLDAVAQECADATISQWRDRLGGVDIFALDNCFTLALYLMIR